MKIFFAVFFGIIAAVIVLGITCAVCMTPIGEVDKPPVGVLYRVSGTADEVDVTFTNKDGGISQDSEKWLKRGPWEYDFSAKPGTFLSLSAQNQTKYGTVRVEILVNGKVMKTSESAGAYKIASASMRL